MRFSSKSHIIPEAVCCLEDPDAYHRDPLETLLDSLCIDIPHVFSTVIVWCIIIIIYVPC